MNDKAKKILQVRGEQWVHPSSVMVDGQLAKGVAFTAMAGVRLDIDCGGWKSPSTDDPAEIPALMEAEVLAFHAAIRKRLIEEDSKFGAFTPISIEAPTFGSEPPHDHVGWRRVINDNPQKINL